MSSYSKLCIWPDAIDPTESVHQICVNLGKSATETLAMIRQVFGEESISRIRMFEWIIGSGQTERGETGEVHVNSSTCSSFYLILRRFFIKNLF
jgi:hypothetical protein